MNRARHRRDEAIHNAKSCAAVDNWRGMLKYIRRAAQSFPITKIQIWSIRQVIGPYKFEELNLDRFVSADTIPMRRAKPSRSPTAPEL